MAEDQAQLDSSLNQLTSEVQTVVTDVNNLIAAIKASGTPDFTSEVNQVEAAISALQSADTSAQTELGTEASAPAPAPSSDSESAPQS